MVALNGYKKKARANFFKPGLFRSCRESFKSEKNAIEKQSFSSHPSLFETFLIAFPMFFLVEFLYPVPALFDKTKNVKESLATAALACSVDPRTVAYC